MCARGIAGCFGINERPRAARRHSEQSHCSGCINTEAFTEKLARLLRVGKAETNHRTAAANRWHEARVFRGRQDHVRAGWRLFERFEERVLRRFVHAVGALDERNAAATLYGEESEASGESADRVDADLVRSSGRRDHDQVGVAT
jgi:hypothetical protein